VSDADDVVADISTPEPVDGYGAFDAGTGATAVVDGLQSTTAPVASRYTALLQHPLQQVAFGFAGQPAAHGSTTTLVLELSG